MKKSNRSLCIAIVLLQFAISTTLFAGKSPDTDSTYISKVSFYSARQELNDMLSGKTPLSYERAIFIIENAYRDNKFDYADFQSAINYHVNKIKKISEINRNFNLKIAPTLFETERQQAEKYNKALLNFSIFKYITDTIFTFYPDINIYTYHLPYQYSTIDPLGTIDWRNTQVLNLFDVNERQGNCYALVSLFEIFSERMNTEANICTAPGHVYIRHADNNGIHYNVELATRSFPGTGTIETLTFTTKEAIVNNISLRELNLKQSVALCLVYLAKGYEYKFGVKDDDFILQCSELALQYDSLNLNALLLKAEVLETKALHKNKTIIQLQTDKQFKEYEKLIVHLYNLGYREMPMEMKNYVIAKLRKDSTAIIINNQTPHPFAHLGVKEDRYATLSGGQFDEMHEAKPFEQYQRTIFDIKRKKITKFVKGDSLYDNYNFDPVVFAWSIDPLTQKYPSWSPYSAFADNPIVYVDNDGREVTKSDAFKQSENREAAYQTFILTTNARNLLDKFATTNSGDYTSPTSGALSKHNFQFDTQSKGNLGLTTFKIEINGKFEEYNPKRHGSLVDKNTRFQVQVNLFNEKNAGAGAAILNHEAFVFAEEYANALEAFQSGKMSGEEFNQKLKDMNESTGIDKAYEKVLDSKSTYTSAQKELIQTLKSNNRTKDAAEAQNVYDTDVKQVQQDQPKK